MTEDIIKAPILSGRITGKKLVQWANAMFRQFEISEYVVTKVVRTNYNTHAYEGGAAKLLFFFDYSDASRRGFRACGYFLSTYSMKDIEEYISKGYEPYMSAKDRLMLLTDLSLELRKI